MEQAQIKETLWNCQRSVMSLQTAELQRTGVEVQRSLCSAARKLSPKRQNPLKSIMIEMKFGRGKDTC